MIIAEAFDKFVGLQAADDPDQQIFHADWISTHPFLAIRIPVPRLEPKFIVLPSAGIAGHVQEQPRQLISKIKNALWPRLV